ncbi:CBS domain-containing protein [Propylenella binzhouense]|uniref:CBS domain-containing protein n=1 Tax=Propylenella binzhouense TaxID=2555902 RepID=A0A964T4M3_9HYPH|nr:CBS domain-containing protein [Propylenella binzhouense]MYZ47837.1 CBS domain-containing protein [Propylenella binzhouense]
MTVLRILNEKGRDVVTTTPAMKLIDVAKLLHQKNIGAVLITEGESIRGILSERDIARAISVHGEEALSKTAGDCMTAHVVTCTPEDSIGHVMQVMTTGRFRHVPVIEKNRLAGLVSIGDVVKRRIEDVEKEAEQIREYIATA